MIVTEVISVPLSSVDAELRKSSYVAHGGRTARDRSKIDARIARAVEILEGGHVDGVISLKKWGVSPGPVSEDALVIAREWAARRGARPFRTNSGLVWGISIHDHTTPVRFEFLRA